MRDDVAANIQKRLLADADLLSVYMDTERVVADSRDAAIMIGDLRQATCYCEFCEGLVKAGLIRPEIVDGELRFRQWRMGEWTPGELLGEKS